MAYISGDGMVVDIDVVLSEKIARSGKITSSPIEDNTTVSDHFAKDQDVISITGVCTTNASNKITSLSTLFNTGAICKYVGRNGVLNVVISKFDSDHGPDVSGAFSFSMSLTVIKVSSTQEFTYSTGLSNGQAAAQAKKQTNVGASSPTTKVVDSTTKNAAHRRAVTSVNTYAKGR